MSAMAIVEAGSGVKGKRYPAPLASHGDVVNVPALFWDTLKRFHLELGTKFMVPVIGGKELDLHLLYVEVTRRGGFEKVVAEKKWREISNVFMFSPTATSASYVLRKHYYNLLHHYEQVYLFKLQGLLVSSHAANSVSAFSCASEIAGLLEYPNKGREGISNLFCGAVGTINGKFDCGYLVSVKLGSEILSGVLYHPEQPEASIPTNQPSNAIVPYTAKSEGGARRRRRKRRRRKGGGGGGDPGRPKPNRSGYNFFFAEKHSNLKSLYTDRERELTRKIGECWSNLSPQERMVYQEIGVKDKERYKREMEEYKQRVQLQEAMEVQTETGVEVDSRN